MSECKNITGCRICGNEDLKQILDLGGQPLANALTSSEDAEEKFYPLTLVWCEKCTLVQIKETISPEVLFSDYPYFSSVSPAILKNASEAVQAALSSDYSLDKFKLAVELASNDGYLLKFYQSRRIPVLGIDPAQNIAAKANELGVPTIAKFFTKQVAAEVLAEHGPASVIHANNVLAHVADTNDFVAGIKTLLDPRGGVAVIEVPYLGEMITNREFDTIYHEHLCYFSLLSLETLFDRHGLFIVDVERLPIHGGSLRVFVKHNSVSAGTRSSRVIDLRYQELNHGMDKWKYYSDFQERVDALCNSIWYIVNVLWNDGASIAAYGASAKGSTLMNYIGVEFIRKHISLLVDKSPHKQGKFAPGTGLKIMDPSELNKVCPNYTLLLSWNFKGEITRQESEYLKKGGTFIVPIPNVQFIDEPVKGV